MYMHGRVAKEGEDRLPPKIIIRRTGFGQHMQSVLSPTASRTCVVEKGSPIIVSTAIDPPVSFSKDGRKICVGDCALFKPPHDSPPFIGVICSLAFTEEKNLQLGVTWLYRPSEVKLGKGILLDAEPNEIFYSFHKDETPAASLLHPCKVAFLPKGVELPKGISSFVCRRVYDIENKCLWWLTDQDYIDERQQEVNKLLNRTQKEMDSLVQAGGCSPTVTSAVSHLKSGSDNLQNSATSAPSQMKGKKRERGDPYDPLKREHPSRTDDGGSGLVRAASLLRLETAKITEKGGLVDSESVEKLVELMQSRTDRKLDIVTRSMVTGVIASTDRFDCLSQFVQLKGLSVLDEWLQDVHKGRLGDTSGSKDGDKSVEDFLLVLLRALDKLPVNLHALQTCNIGRSVNHLRSHKNMEVQKKARTLVDTWKKRVEAEMNVMDSRSVSPQAAAWPSKSRLPEVHGGRTSGGSCDGAFKSSAAPPVECKTALTKTSSGETTIRSVCSSPGPIKSSTLAASGKEAKPRALPNNSPADVPLSNREEKNSSSVSPHVSVREDTRFPIAGTMNINKIPSGGMRHRKSNNCYIDTQNAGSQKETACRSSLVRENAAHEKFSHSTVTSEKTSTMPLAESSTQKLIVKIPNRSRSAAQSPTGGSGDMFVTSGRASPAPSHKRECDQDSKNCENRQGNVASHVNAESLHDNNHKDLQAGSDVDDGTSPALHDESLNKKVTEDRRLSEGCRTPFSSLEKDLKVKKLCEASSSAMDALIESCAKYSEESASTSPGDDVGMNLLASVAAREMCSSESAPLPCSLQHITPPKDEGSTRDSTMLKQTSGDNLPLDGCLTDAVTIDENETVVAGSGMRPAEGLHVSNEVSVEHSGDSKPCSAMSKDVMKVIVDCSTATVDKSANAFSGTSEVAERGQSSNGESFDEKHISLTAEACGVPDTKADGHGSSLAEVKMSKVVSDADYNKKVEMSLSAPSDEIDCKKGVNENFSSSFNVESKPALVANGEISKPIVSIKGVVCETFNAMDAAHADKKCINGEVVLESALLSQNSGGDDKSIVSKLSADETDNTEKKDSAVVVDTPLSTSGPLEDSKMDFDLNEVLLGDDGNCEELLNSGMPMSVSTASSVTVTAAAKGHFVPPVDLLKTKGEVGWKGSAATSAFRPAEPRKVPQFVSPVDDSANKLCRRPFDIDLNVADETCQDSASDTPSTSDQRFLHNSRNEVMGTSASCSGGLGLDLNRVDDANFTMQCPASSSHGLAAPALPFKSLFPSAVLASEVKRDFDLNNGPDFEDGVAEQSSLNQLSGRSAFSMHSLLPVSGFRPNSLEIGNLSTCFPHANPYPVSISSVLPDRVEHPVPIVTPVAPQKLLGSSSGNPFMPDMYRGTVLSSSPAVPFPSAPFPYQMFPFGTTLPLSSGTFSVGSGCYLDSASAGRLSTPTVNSQFLGPVSAVASQYPRPFMIGLPDGSNNVGMESSSRKWSRTGLDLNAGPGVLDVEGRDDFMPQRQLLVSSSHTVAEDQGRMYPVTGGVLKRKEPEGGLDRESFRYKQPSWQ